MSLEVKGKIVKVLQEEKGESKAGKAWFKAGYVVETFDQYPKRVAFTVMSEKLMPVVKSLAIGQEVTTHFNLESREYQDKWFSNITAWKIDKATQGITESPVNKPMVMDDLEPLPF